MNLFHEPDDIRDVLHHVVADDLVEGGRGERPRRLVQVVDHVRVDGWTPIEVRRTLDPLVSATEVEDPASGCSCFGVGLFEGCHAFALTASGRSPRYAARQRRTTAGHPKWSIILRRAASPMLSARGTFR